MRQAAIMRQAATRELFDYWNSLRRGRAAPDRAEIEPAAIRNVLADTFMLDLDPARRFPIRLSGSRMNALFCAEMKGRGFLDLWSLAEAATMTGLLLTVAEITCPLVLSASAAPKGYAELDLEIILLPLRHGGHANSRILGSLSSNRKLPWLGLLPVEKLILRSAMTVNGSFIERAGEELTEPPGEMPRMSAAGAVFERRAHLRVFRGGK